MKIKYFKTLFIEELSPFFDVLEIEQFYYLVLRKIHNLKRIDIALNPESEANECEIGLWKSILEQLKNQEPIQYILGETSFSGLQFEVNKHTLIPRPETEELVELICNRNKSNEKVTILDIGTGSGCIAISLAKIKPNFEVHALDVSEEALLIATKNSKLNNVKVQFSKKDILKTNFLNQNFDIIVSNPPYVRNLEKENMSKNVLDFEPHLALFVSDNNPLLYYEKIAEIARKNLNKNGQLYFEINQYLAKETEEMLSKMNFKNIEVFKDIYNNDRMIAANYS